MTNTRSILHVDMDAFYASIEQREHPELSGQPLVVGGGGNRGVVAAASYEARQFGIHSAMPMREARQRCSHLLQVPPRMALYQSVSTEVFAIFREFTPLVEGLSLDEAFLDVSDSLALFGDDIQIATAIKTRIDAATQLTASVGVAPNKLVAKIASDLKKPDGLVVVRAENVNGTLDPLPVAAIPGIGKRAQSGLEELGIRTIRDLRRASDTALKQVFGRFADRMRARAHGVDARPVVASRDEKSVSAEETFASDIADKTALLAKLLELSERTAARLRAKNLVARTVQVKIRTADFQTFTRQMRVLPPSNLTDQVYSAATRALVRWLSERPGQALRLLGVGGADLAPAVQADLFSGGSEERHAEVDRAVDAIREKFGNQAMSRARSLDSD